MAFGAVEFRGAGAPCQRDHRAGLRRCLCAGGDAYAGRGDKSGARGKALDVDGVVSVGGGSAIGLGEATSLRTGLPRLAIPTTYAGSEMTPILGETRNGLKRTQRDPAILPATVIFDVDLTLGLPTPLSATSGINAMAHAVEALYAVDTNPTATRISEEGLSKLAPALPAIVAQPCGSRSSISGALWRLPGCACLGEVLMALHHKLCHTLGGACGDPYRHTALRGRL